MNRWRSTLVDVAIYGFVLGCTFYADSPHLWRVATCAFSGFAITWRVLARHYELGHGRWREHEYDQDIAELTAMLWECRGWKLQAAAYARVNPTTGVFEVRAAKGDPPDDSLAAADAGARP